jgi:hypothetical protein
MFRSFKFHYFIYDANVLYLVLGHKFFLIFAFHMYIAFVVMCVRVQVTFPYNSTGLFNVLYTLVLLFQWICLDLNTVCREGTIPTIHRKSSSWFSHYTIWAIAPLNTMSGWFKITDRLWKGWGRPLQSVWGPNNVSKQNCFSLQFGGSKRNSKSVGISLTVGEMGRIEVDGNETG